MSQYPTTIRAGKQYLGNTNEKEVHNLHNEKTSCQIDKILLAGHAVGFTPDTHDEARRLGFDNCQWCIGGSLR